MLTDEEKILLDKLEKDKARLPELTTREDGTLGYYRKKAESTTWQAVCPQCYAEFTEAHLCRDREKISLARAKQIIELEEKINELENERNRLR